jgi:hypothetical protein
VELIGNPWLKRTAWDAVVNNEPARLMVNSWLKQRLIKDFFGLLAADGAADPRRLDYWLKWEPRISDMWFVLGREAQENRTPAFLELRKRMAGRDRQLIDNNHLNNAFVMRIGPLLIIEFGLTGNACYIFAASDFRANLEQSTFKLVELKQRYGVAARLSHSGWNWEGNFSVEIGHLLANTSLERGELTGTHEINRGSPQKNPFIRDTSVNPSRWAATGHANKTDVSPTVRSNALADSNWPSPVAPPVSANSISTSSPYKSANQPGANSGPQSIKRSKISELEVQQLKRLIAKHGLECEDNRPKGGALWVLTAEKDLKPIIASVFSLYGFRFAEGKGYWLKDE